MLPTLSWSVPLELLLDTSVNNCTIISLGDISHLVRILLLLSLDCLGQPNFMPHAHC